MRKLSVPNDFFADAAEALKQGQTVKLRIERVKCEDIIGLLHAIHRPIQDCCDPRWLKKTEWWYRLRYIRRWLLPIMKTLHVR